MKFFKPALAALAALCLPAIASAETVFGLIGSARIVTFDSLSPNTVASNLAISGLATGTVLTGIDLRPANGLLYSISTTGTIYSLSNIGTSYQAVAVATMSVTPTGSNFGIDFNPTVDRLRFIGSDGQNLRINADTGATTVDTAITNSNGRVANPALVGSAYTNNVAGATATTLYGIDGATSRLLVSSAPNTGVYSNVGTALLGPTVTTTSSIGFDISGATGIAYLSTDGNGFYTVDLTTGVATNVGAIGAGTLRQITGIAVAAAVPEPASWGMMIVGFGLVGTMARRRSNTARAAA